MTSPLVCNLGATCNDWLDGLICCQRQGFHSITDKLVAAEKVQPQGFGRMAMNGGVFARETDVRSGPAWEDSKNFALHCRPSGSSESDLCDRVQATIFQHFDLNNLPMLYIH